jgi:hypothetical protein
MRGNDDFRVRPGKIRSTRGPQTKSFLAQALQAAQKAGGLSRGPVSRGSRFGRGRAASLAASRMLQARARGAMVKGGVVRQMRLPGALRAHIGYLKRDGVTRDGSPGKLFDGAGDDADCPFRVRTAVDNYVTASYPPTPHLLGTPVPVEEPSTAS